MRATRDCETECIGTEAVMSEDVGGNGGTLVARVDVVT